MDEEFSFWFPVTYYEQTTFEGQNIRIEKLEEGHVIHGGRPLCGESREVLLNRLHTKDFKQVKTRPQFACVCSECLRKYKMNGHSAYQIWVNGEPRKVVATLSPLVKLVSKNP